MFLKKHEKRSLSPWCVIMVGGLAAVGAISIVSACKDSIKEKTRAIASMFRKKERCHCESMMAED